MARSRRIALALLASCASLAQAQTPTVSDAISVELVNVDVRVRGSDGAPVEGLPREAFRVYDRGELVELTHFAWVPRREPDAIRSAEADSTAGAAAGGGPRNIAIFFDEMQIGERSRKPLLDALRERLARSLEPGDRVSVVRFDGAELGVLLPWSTDRRRLDAVLADLEGFSLQRLVLGQELNTYLEWIFREVYDPTAREESSGCPTVGNTARIYAETVRRYVEASGSALLRYAQRLSHEPGRRILFHVSDGIPLVAGGEVYQFAIDMCGGKAAAEGVPGAVSTSVIDPSGEFQSDRFNPRTAAMDMSFYEMGPYWTEIAASLNAHNVTVYPIQAAEAGGRFLPNTEGRILSPSVQFMAQNNPVDTLSLLARETGGLLVRAGRGVDSQLDRLMADLGGYYSLAFTPRASGTPGVRRIRVEVDRDGVDLRYRQSYRMLGRDERVAGQLAEIFEAEGFDNPLELRLAVRHAEGSADRHLRVLVPFDKLSLIDSPEGGQEGRFTVYVAIRDARGRVLIPRQRSIVARRADPRALAYTYEIALPDDRGQVAVAVLDEYSGNLAFARERLVTR